MYPLAKERFRTIGFIAFLVIVWGLCWPIYKMTLQYTPPILFAGMRTLLGGIGLSILALSRYRQIQFRTHWKVYLVSALFNAVLFYGIQTVGLKYLPSGLFSVIVYLQPVLVGFLAWYWLRESLNLFKVTGLILGVIGVGVVSWDGMAGHLSATGIILALITAISWAIGTVYMKKEGTNVDTLWLVSLQCVIGGAVMTVAGLAVEDAGQIVWNLPYVSGLLFGAFLGIAAAWVVYFKLVRTGEASRIASYTFFVPLLSVWFGAIFLKEPLSFHLALGLLFIILSILLVNRKEKRKKPLPSA
ncbi:DMT family transporter [Thermoactinomyces sp. CICC 10521]|uniref:DMT family transporter n=1 Tax=Thermoactinomyces daqus TaxID=1329516 RepID=A0A7W1X9Z1_9BACL|nr:DMT family transporter [Thermoactinomyces daqus]MBA4542852.1 DMT family transporter [Thermoactinomyces daqus]MBH8596700.1 DMT family transporter [Thermoactinomyces sp. CICC 10523]MBH8603462.1 DMT family transporter [Thermoactinomyces sp. CICC 10522]MBH8606627.1 DMT family transporter [Thermoactinomyces sp. CICC 10521]